MVSTQQRLKKLTLQIVEDTWTEDISWSLPLFVFIILFVMIIYPLKSFEEMDVGMIK